MADELILAKARNEECFVPTKEKKDLFTSELPVSMRNSLFDHSFMMKNFHGHTALKSAKYYQDLAIQEYKRGDCLRMSDAYLALSKVQASRGREYHRQAQQCLKDMKCKEKEERLKYLSQQAKENGGVTAKLKRTTQNFKSKMESKLIKSGMKTIEAKALKKQKRNSFLRQFQSRLDSINDMRQEDASSDEDCVADIVTSTIDSLPVVS